MGGIFGAARARSSVVELWFYTPAVGGSIPSAPTNVEEEVAMPATAPTPFFTSDNDGFVPNQIAQGGWGPTLGGHVVGGLLARSVESKRADSDLVPARFTVDILRRVAAEPVEVRANVVRTGRRMQAIDATMTQGGELVARASTLFLRRSAQPAVLPWTTDICMPPVPAEPTQFDD